MDWITIGVLTFDALALVFAVVALIGSLRGAKAERERKMD